MASGEVRLVVSRESYQNQIELLQGYLNRLDNTISQYQQKETELDSFMTGDDDNYQKMRESVEQNIRTVQKAREMCDASIQMMRQTLQEMESFGENVGRTLDSAFDAAKSGITTAFDVMNTLG